MSTPESQRAAEKRYREKNPDKVRQWNKNSRDRNPRYHLNAHFVKSYGITLEEYEEKVKSQNNLCAICKNPETRTLNGKVKRLGVDHSHISGQTRDLLCADCNTGLAWFKEHILYLQAAIDYLKRHS